jgi:hypothetical protein
VATGEYQITKEVGSFDGHFTNRFRRRTCCEKKMFGSLFGKRGIKVPARKELKRSLKKL